MKLIRLFLMLTAMLALGGCGAESKEDSPFKVIDTGYWPAEVNPLAEPLWLDNERIVFTSTENLTPGKGPHSVKVMNTATGKLMPTRFHTAFCVRSGVAVFQEKNALTGKTTDYRGTLESYREEPRYSDNMTFDRLFDCDWVPKKTYGLLLDVGKKSKLRGENYLELLEKRTKHLEHEKRHRDRRREQETGDTGTEGKLIYHQNSNDPGREIPFYGVTYSEYLDAYVVGGHYYDPKEPETHSFRILQRNGDLREIPYPKIMLEGRVDIYPVRPGYLVHYYGGPLTEKEGTRGLYLIQGEQVHPLIIGDIGHAVISPDGCKAAFIHARNTKEALWLPKPTTTVKLINFCQGGATS